MIEALSDDPHYGWNPDLDIPSALRILGVGDQGDSFALISMLDSAPNVAELPTLVPRIEAAGIWLALVGRNVVIEASAALDLVQDESLFAGFDELWLCLSPPGTDKPRDLRITSDGPLEAAPPADALRWMRAASCVTGLGDGDGLNYLTFDRAVAAALGQSHTG